MRHRHGSLLLRPRSRISSIDCLRPRRKPCWEPAAHGSSADKQLQTQDVNRRRRNHSTLRQAAGSSRSNAALGNLSVKRLWAYAYLIGDKLPLPLLRHAVAVPYDPGIEPLSDRL
jgi:hypothetical protein